MRPAFLLVQLLDGFETTADSVPGGLMREAGFIDAIKTPRQRTRLGTPSLYRAARPA